jgi:hypothetical protein
VTKQRRQPRRCQRPEADTPVPESDKYGLGSAAGIGGTLEIPRGTGVATKVEMDGQIAEPTQVWAIEGSTLTVETTNTRGTQKRVYKK